MRVGIGLCLLLGLSILATFPIRAEGVSPSSAHATPVGLDRSLVYLEPAESEVTTNTMAGASEDGRNLARSALLEESLRDSFTTALSKIGLREMPRENEGESIRAGSGISTPGANNAIATARTVGAGWTAVCRVRPEGELAVASLAVYETETADLVAAETLALRSGPTALAILEDAARRGVERLSSFREWRDSGSRPDGGYGLLVALSAAEPAIMDEEALGAFLLSYGKARFVHFAPSTVNDPAAVSPALSCRVNLAIAVSTNGDGHSLLAWELSDSAKGRASTHGSSLTSAPDAVSLADSFWIPVALATKDFLSVPLPPILLTVSGMPGTRFEAGRLLRQIPDKGSFTVELADDQPLDWRAREPGAYEVAGRITPKGTSPLRLRIPRRLMGIELGAYGLGFPEMRATLALGRRWFIRAGLVQFIAGAGSKAGSPAIVSSPLLEPRIGGGFAFAERSSDFHPYVAFDAFARLSLLGNNPLVLDATAPFGVEPAFGLDWGRGPGFRLWGEIGLALYPYADPARLYASMAGRTTSLLTIGGGPLFVDHPGWLAELPVARLGFRVGL